MLYKGQTRTAPPPLAPETIVSRTKAPPAKGCEKGYGDENGIF